MRVLSVLTALLALGLCACTTATPYQPAPMPGDYGFHEQRIEANRFRITFQGNSATPRETVERFLLYRAAELTRLEGYDYFIMLESDTEANRRYTVTNGHPAFYGRYHYLGPRHHRFDPFPYYAYGFGWSFPYDPDIREFTRYSAVAYIVMHKGEKPADDPLAFDARAVMENLGPGILSAGPVI